MRNQRIPLVQKILCLRRKSLVQSDTIFVKVKNAVTILKLGKFMKANQELKEKEGKNCGKVP